MGVRWKETPAGDEVCSNAYAQNVRHNSVSPNLHSCGHTRLRSGCQSALSRVAGENNLACAAGISCQITLHSEQDADVIWIFPGKSGHAKGRH
eukprot:1660936-Amphidinium_carterae.1